METATQQNAVPLDAIEAARIVGMNSRTLVRWARRGYVPAQSAWRGETPHLALLRERAAGLGREAKKYLCRRRTGRYDTHSHRCSCEEGDCMSRFQQGSLLRMKRKGAPDAWVFRWYEHKNGRRRYMKRTIGTVVEFPQRRDAEKALLSFRYTINSQVAAPQQVCDLITHYQQREPVPERKSFSSISTHLGMTRRYIEPRWGCYHLSDVRTMQVEEWLHSLPLAPASKTKIKSAFSVLYSHAIRYEWLTFNPISKVRTSSKPLREKMSSARKSFRHCLESFRCGTAQWSCLSENGGLATT